MGPSFTLAKLFVIGFLSWVPTTVQLHTLQSCLANFSKEDKNQFYSLETQFLQLAPIYELFLIGFLNRHQLSCGATELQFPFLPSRSNKAQASICLLGPSQRCSQI